MLGRSVRSLFVSFWPAWSSMLWCENSQAAHSIGFVLMPTTNTAWKRTSKAIHAARHSTRPCRCLREFSWCWIRLRRIGKWRYLSWRHEIVGFAVTCSQQQETWKVCYPRACLYFVRAAQEFVFPCDCCLGAGSMHTTCCQRRTGHSQCLVPTHQAYGVDMPFV